MLSVSTSHSRLVEGLLLACVRSEGTVARLGGDEFAVDEWALGEACRQIDEWDQAGLPPIRMSVNISARHFRKEGMAGDLIRIIDAQRVDPRRLCLEITESVLMDIEHAQKMLAELVAFGLTISIDDFGTGFSSLSYLKRFPIHELKIARSFVDGVSIDADDRAIGSAIIAMARHLGMSVVAEGVELLAQASELNTSGCHNGQGFLYARPLSPEDFADWLREHSDALGPPGQVVEPVTSAPTPDGDKA